MIDIFAPTASEDRERQRVTHLVLGAVRPRVAPARRRAKKRPAQPMRLAPDIEERVALRERWSHKQGTPETHEHADAVRRRPGALARLYQSGAIDADQLAAAEQIAHVHRLLTADVRVRTANYDTRTDGGRAGEDEAPSRVRDERTYDRWRRAIGADAEMLLAMIVDDLPVTIAAGRYRHGVRSVQARLGMALARWWIERRSASAETFK